MEQLWKFWQLEHMVPHPKSVRGKKLKYKTMVKYEPFYCRKKGCCYSLWWSTIIIKYSRLFHDVVSCDVDSGYSAPGSRIAGMEIHVFRNEYSSQTNAYSRYSKYSYSRLIPNERALKQSLFSHFMYTRTRSGTRLFKGWITLSSR